MKKRVLSCLLALVLLLSALPVGGYADQSPAGAAVHSGYTVAASPDVTAGVGKTVSVTVSLTAGGSYNAYDLTLTYDTALLSFVSGQAADRSASVTERNGTVRIIGYGANKTASAALAALEFKTKTAGTANVTIVSAKIDSSANAGAHNAPEAAVSKKTTKITVQARFTVTLDDGLTADELAAETGTDYTFRATDPLHYNYKPTAKINGKDVTVKDNGDGTYTIPGSEITGDITVKANRTPKSYKVTLNGTDLSGAKSATYNTAYHFKLNRASGYSYVLRVTIGGKAYTGYKGEDGGYRIPGTDITGDIVITALKNKINSGNGSNGGNNSTGGTTARNVSVVFIGSGAEDASGAGSTRRGAEYTFKINGRAGCSYDVSARVNGVTVSCTYDSSRGVYRIPGTAVTGDITITVSRSVALEVNAYLTLDRQCMYLVVYKGGVEKDHVPMYDGQNMYWSEAYKGYAWLVTSSASADEVMGAAQSSVTIGEGQAAASIGYTGDVDLSGRIDLEDAGLACDMYNARCTLNGMEMHKFLRADVNGDRKVDVEDAVWIITRILLGREGA